VTAPSEGARLRDLIGAEPFVTSVVMLDRVASTNDEVRELAARGAPAGTVVVARQQTAGRGRLGRQWYSPPGLGLYVSVLLRPGGPVAAMPRYTLAAAVAAAAACREAGATSVEIKWPNDLVADGRKVGGVLAELRPSAPGAELVLGLGINVGHRAEDFPPALAAQATSLRLLTGTAPDPELLAAGYLRALAREAREIEDGRWTKVAARWERLAPGARGRRVRVCGERGGARAVEGRTAGIDSSGALIVRGDDGQAVAVHAVDTVTTLED